MRNGKIVRIFDHGIIIQVLCADERGLLSVYLEREPFNSFYRATKRAGLKLKGLCVNFDKDLLSVPALGKHGNYSTR